MAIRRARGRPAQGSLRGQQPASEFCSVAEAAESLGVSVSTVWRWVDSGTLAAFRLGPKAIRIRRADLEAAVQPVTGRNQLDMESRVFHAGEAAVRRLTREEKERGLAALAAADKLREQILARRKGKPLADSAAIIRDARAERSRRA